MQSMLLQRPSVALRVPAAVMLQTSPLEYHPAARQQKETRTCLHLECEALRIPINLVAERENKNRPHCIYPYIHSAWPCAGHTAISMGIDMGMDGYNKGVAAHAAASCGGPYRVANGD